MYFVSIYEFSARCGSFIPVIESSCVYRSDIKRITGGYKDPKYFVVIEFHA